MRRGKYNAKATVVDGIRFASKRESLFYLQLRDLLRTGRIKDLELQPRFPMPPGPDWFRCDWCDRILKIPREQLPGSICTYVADFRYTWLKGPDAGKTMVVDVKGMRTPMYRLKIKMIKHFYPTVEVIEA